jgi:subtilase family serine protease
MDSAYSSRSGLWIHSTLLGAIALMLSACVGGESSSSTAAPSDAGSGSTMTFVVTLGNETVQPASQATPLFHVAPVTLDEPSNADAVEPSSTGRRPPHIQAVPPELALLSTRRLTRSAMDSVLADGVVPNEVAADGPGATPLSSGTTVATYTPAQIRMAYSFPQLPALRSWLTPAQAAELGAGQTIYLIDAHHDSSATAELAAFNAAFGLPACTTAEIPVDAALPLAPAATSGCAFSVVYSTILGGMTAGAPVYDSRWATEIAIDVEWSHATAPMARIILIEAPDSSTNSLLAAIHLANAMGPGVVSMSFGLPEGSWTSSVENAFTNPEMTYVAAAGDAGAKVLWPAVSPHVVAVGGTTLSYSSAGGHRSEVVWTGTGGGVSEYTALPTYQATVPGMDTLKFRSVNDVTFNGDPATGQYLAVIAPGSTATKWLSAGGTSLSTAQWAGIFALANAQRAQVAQHPLGAPHALLYGLASQPEAYAKDFDDVTQGSDGSCASCFAWVGYDSPSGLGTPNITSLLSALVATPSPDATATLAVDPTGPAIAVSSMMSVAGEPLSGTISFSDITSDTLLITISNVPSGMTFTVSGPTLVANWASPVTGNYKLNVAAKDADGKTAVAVVSVTVSAR